MPVNKSIMVFPLMGFLSAKKCILSAAVFAWIIKPVKGLIAFFFNSAVLEKSLGSLIGIKDFIAVKIYNVNSLIKAVKDRT